MATRSVKKVVGAHNIPKRIRRLSSLPRVDYADQFTISTDVDAKPERWARAMFGDIPSFTQLLIWRGLLGFRLSRNRSPSTVAGWQIDGCGEDWIRLKATSWFLAGNLLIQRGTGQVSLVTFLHYRRWLGHLVWPLLSALHRKLVPKILRSSLAKIQAPQ